MDNHIQVYWDMEHSLWRSSPRPLTVLFTSIDSCGFAQPTPPSSCNLSAVRPLPREGGTQQIFYTGRLRPEV